MERLGIDHLADRFPDEVSLGEQQRTALARAAVVRPRVLVADEPISHQNHEWASAMMLLVADLAETATSCLLAPHNDPALSVGQRVLFLRWRRMHDTPFRSSACPSVSGESAPRPASA